MAVHIIQLLCPKRHAIIAFAYEVEALDDASALAKLRLQWTEMTATGGYNPWCGICRSPDLTFETGTTGFATLAEAGPHLRATEILNILSRYQIEEGRERKN